MMILSKDECFFDRDLNQTKNFDVKKHKGSILDDTSIKYLDRKSKISLIKPNSNKVINVKYGTREIQILL